jgi:hypothetical protein
MVQKSRSKEVWLVPKRGSLHQMICLVESIINRNYDETRWNEQKQNNVGNDLRKRGAVRKKVTPSNQSIRTLLASVPQYFGFIYIDDSTTPNTIKLTEAGKNFYEHHKNQLKNIGTLSEGSESGDLIQSSKVFLEQFEKLQITNPIILKDCENIFVFPFRLILKLLMALDYLDREELAYFVFSIKDEDELPLVTERIKRFRSQKKVDRDVEIKLFKDTHIGNITLVQAPSASYFENLAVNTGIIEKLKISKPNPGCSIQEKITAIKIKPESKSYVLDILNNKYSGAEIYDFKNRRNLWIDYIGSPERLIPPRDIQLINKSKNSVIMTVEKNGLMLDGDLVESDCSLLFPMFINEDYNIILISPHDGVVLDRVIITPDFSKLAYDFKVKVSTDRHESIEDIGNKIIEHSQSKNFESNFLSYLNILENIIGADLTSNKNLRGAYYEYLFYQLLERLKDEGIIDDVYWNGHIGQYGLPRPAPGGKTGTPDIVFELNGEYFIKELTTIKAKSTQFKAEGSSVPDHIKLFAESNEDKKINGIFSAPLIHTRNTSAMQAVLEPTGVTIKCIEDINLVKLLLTKDKNKIFSELKNK